MSEPTAIFSIYDDKDKEIREVLTSVYRALKEKGYNPIDRDDLLQVLLKNYLGE